MKKPTKKQVKAPMLNWFDIQKFIENKYKINLRDYAGTFKNGHDESKPYQDFWHFMVDQTELRNDSATYLSLTDWMEDKETTDWQKEIIKLIQTEFAKDLDKDGGLEVWVSW